MEACKVLLTEEQWDFIKRQDLIRTEDVLKTGEAQRETFQKIVAMLSESVTAQTSFSRRDYFVSQFISGRLAGGASVLSNTIVSDCEALAELVMINK